MNCKFVGSDVFFQKNRLVLRHRSEAANAGAHFVGIEMQALRDEIGIGGQIARRIAQQQRGERRIVIDDDAAFAIENLAAGREHGHVANAIFFGG